MIITMNPEDIKVCVCMEVVYNCLIVIQKKSVIYSEVVYKYILSS